MYQVINGLPVFVVEFDAMPELPITGLTPGEQTYQSLAYLNSYPHGLAASLLNKRPTYAEALTDAIQTGVITEPGKYAIHLVPGTTEYTIYRVVE